MHYAAYYGDGREVKLLLEWKAAKDTRPAAGIWEGKTPLELAIKRAKQNSMQLLDGGSDIAAN